MPRREAIHGRPPGSSWLWWDHMKPDILRWHEAIREAYDGGDVFRTPQLKRAFANLLSRQLGRTVVDKTGLAGKYDLTLEWAPEESELHREPGPSLFTAIQEQLGLKLESEKAPVEILAIDHIDRPLGELTLATKAPVDVLVIDRLETSPTVPQRGPAGAAACAVLGLHLCFMNSSSQSW